MMRWIDIAAALVITFLGVGHTVLTPVFAPGWTQSAAWFAGSGLALVMLGLLNLGRLWGGGDARRLLWLCVAANGLMFVWMVFVIAVLPVHQAFLAATAVLGCLVASLATARAPAVSLQQRRRLAP